jgi:DNA-binding SARP family transcriptional activator
VTTTHDAPVTAASAVEWRLNVLGPVELCLDGRPVAVTGPARTLLAILARAPGQWVSVETAIAAFWGDSPPDAAEKRIAEHAARLAKALAPSDDTASILAVEPTGLRLSIDHSNVDLAQFERLVEEGRRALSLGQPVLAAARLDAGLQLWRGDAYAGLSETFARAEASRLAEQRLAAIESRVDAQLAASAPGVPPALLAELQALVAEHSHRERLWVQLMIAFHRLGRQGDAIATNRQACARLLELGLGPGAELRAAERAILANDPALSGTPVAPTPVPSELASSLPTCVGRDEELAWLDAALDMAVARRGQARLIIGGQGVGKTRLVAEVAHRAAARGVHIRYARENAEPALVAEPDRPSLVIVDDLDRAPREDLPRVLSFIRTTIDRPVLTLLTARNPVRVGDLAGLPRLVLTTLDDQAIADIVRVYAPNTTDATAVAAMVNAGGVPARIHRAASEWAFARAGRRIDRAVADAPEPRRWNTSIRDEIVAGVTELEHVRTQARALRPTTRDVPACPYKGLDRYEASDADIFHGREGFVADLVARLVQAPLLAVVGPSGGGKSSVLRAGLVPALAAGVLPGSAQWRPTLVTPATAGNLRTRLAANRVAATAESPANQAGQAGDTAPASGAGSARDLLVIDQFEEAFSQLDGDRRMAFLATVADLARADRAAVVIAVRSDSYPQCAENASLSSLVTANTVLVPRLSAEEVRRAIECPAAAARLSLEEGLVDLLIEEMRDPAVTLSHLSAALLSMWQSRTGQVLTIKAHRAGGGLAGAVAALAEPAYAALKSEGDRQVFRQILVNLADPAVGHGPVGRRVATAELERLAGGTFGALAMLERHGLLRFDADVAEVVHEILFTDWPRMRGWLAEDLAERQHRTQISAAASAWAAAGGPPDQLCRGAQLIVALDRAEKHPGELSGPERAFLTASHSAAVAEERRRRHGVARLRQLLAAAVLALVIAVTGGVLAVIDQQQAASASRTADARRLAAEALVEPDLRLAALLAVAATKLDDNPQIRAGVRSVLLRSPSVVAAAGAAGTTASTVGADRMTAMALSADGRLLAVGLASGAVLLYVSDPVSLDEGFGPARRLEYPEHGPVNGIAFTPDGKRMVSWGGAQTASTNERPASIVVWDVASASPVGDAFGEAWPDAGGLLADGVTLVLRQQHPADQRPPTIVAWNIDARTPSTAYELPTGPVGALTLTPDGNSVIVSAGSRTLIVRPTTGATKELSGVDKASALSPDGTTLLVADGADVVLRDANTDARRGEGRRHLGDVLATAWAPDGRTFASVGADGLAIVWDATTRRPRATFAGHSMPLRLVAFAIDGRTLFTAGEDGMLLAWDLTSTRGIGARLENNTDPREWTRSACALAGRDLTPEEWRRHVPSHPYEPVCP